MSFASLFAEGPTPVRPAPIHTVETDEPEKPALASPKKTQAQDNFVEINGREVADTKTVNRWASAIENLYPVEVRQITSVGHPTNIYGCWVFEKFKLSALGERKEGKHERLRYADATQMKEIYEALGESDRFWRLVSGYDEHGQVLPGPHREGRPPTDAKGQPIEEQPSRGDHGPLPDECAWIEGHDSTFIEYLGTDPQWPNGCWQVEKSGCETQYLDMNGIKYVAHNTLGMPWGAVAAAVPNCQYCGAYNFANKKQLKAHERICDQRASAESEFEALNRKAQTTPTGGLAARFSTLFAEEPTSPAQNNGHGFASLFADEPEEAQEVGQPATVSFASLFA